MTDEAAAPAPAPAPSAAPEPAPSAAPAAPAAKRPVWTPPDTLADKFSRFSTRAVQYSVAAFGLLSLVMLVLWLVPAVVVSRSDAYAAAKAYVAGRSELQAEAGAPITCDRLPGRYRLGGPEGDVFRFEFEGPRGRGEAEVTVKDGQATALRFYVLPRF